MTQITIERSERNLRSEGRGPWPVPTKPGWFATSRLGELWASRRQHDRDLPVCSMHGLLGTTPATRRPPRLSLATGPLPHRHLPPPPTPGTHPRLPTRTDRDRPVPTTTPLNRPRLPPLAATVAEAAPDCILVIACCHLCRLENGRSEPCRRRAETPTLRHSIRTYRRRTYPAGASARRVTSDGGGWRLRRRSW
jgi:hypothetical protein